MEKEKRTLIGYIDFFEGNTDFAFVKPIFRNNNKVDELVWVDYFKYNYKYSYSFVPLDAEYNEYLNDDKIEDKEITLLKESPCFLLWVRGNYYFGDAYSLLTELFNTYKEKEYILKDLDTKKLLIHFMIMHFIGDFLLVFLDKFKVNERSEIFVGVLKSDQLSFEHKVMFLTIIEKNNNYNFFDKFSSNDFLFLYESLRSNHFYQKVYDITTNAEKGVCNNNDIIDYKFVETFKNEFYAV